jgi:hypothetical protein
MKTRAARFAARVGIVAITVGVAVGLTGCLQSTSALPDGTATTPTPSASATAAPTTTSVPTADPGTPKFTEACDILLTSAQVYAYNPNFVADSAYAAQRGTIPGAIAADSGQTCGWVNETSGDKIEVAVATPLAPALAAAKSAASSGKPISAAGQQGYFAVKDGVGSAQFFIGSLWLDISSVDFATAGDAEAIYPTVVQNQLSAGG